MKKLLVLTLCVLMSFSVTACKSEEVKNVESVITALGEIDLEKEDAIIEAEKLYEALPEEDKSKVENYELLETARTEYDDILKDFSDETKFCASAMVSLYNNVDNMDKLDVESIGIVNVDDVNYALVSLSYNGTTSIEGTGLYIITNENILVLGKGVATVDDETGFRIFNNSGKVDSGFKDNYDFNNNVDPTEVYLLTARYFESGDSDFIDIGDLAESQSINETKSFDETLRLAYNVVGNWGEILALQDEFINTEEFYDFDRLDVIYYETIDICEETRRINLSGISEALEEIENKATESLTLMTYENMMMNESFKQLDKETMRLHYDIAEEYYDDFFKYKDQFEEQYRADME